MIRDSLPDSAAMRPPSLATVAIVVHDHDDAIDWYAAALGLRVECDEALDEAATTVEPKRWVVLGPDEHAPRGARLLLARADDDAQRAIVGRQGGGRVWLFFTSDDFARDHARLLAAGATCEGVPRHEPYGTVVVFRDLYGNRCDLIAPVPEEPPA